MLAAKLRSDPRSVDAIRVARLFADGNATQEELSAAAANAAAYAANAANAAAKQLKRIIEVVENGIENTSVPCPTLSNARKTEPLRR